MAKAIHDGFPKDLLSKTVEERRVYFEKKIITHPKLELAFKEAKKKILGDKYPLVLLYGPSGVGKSTLLTKLYNEIISSVLEELVSDKGRIPITFFEAKAAETLKFNWGDFYRAGLLALNEVSIDKKIVPIHHIKHDTAKSSSRETYSALRWAYESALVNRRPLACIVDEAQHMSKIQRGSKLKDQMDVIKSLANITKVPHILAGSYELLHFRDQSAQLSNRSTDVHLPRYQAENKEDIKAFKTIVMTFQDSLPVHEVDLISHWQFLYERCIGCVGVLKQWLERALRESLYEVNNEGKTLSYQQLEKTSRTVKQCGKMLIEAREGELALIESAEDRDNLIVSLGLKLHKEENIENKSKGRSERKPGKRNPKRDPVGHQV
jgi:hypothetical protein